MQVELENTTVAAVSGTGSKPIDAGNEGKSKLTKFDPDAVIVAINDDDRPIKPMGSQNMFKTAEEDPKVYKLQKDSQK